MPTCLEVFVGYTDCSETVACHRLNHISHHGFRIGGSERDRAAITVQYPVAPETTEITHFYSMVCLRKTTGVSQQVNLSRRI